MKIPNIKIGKEDPWYKKAICLFHYYIWVLAGGEKELISVKMKSKYRFSR